MSGRAESVDLYHYFQNYAEPAWSRSKVTAQTQERLMNTFERVISQRFKLMSIVLYNVCTPTRNQRRTEGGTIRGATKVTTMSQVLPSAAHLLPKDLRFEHGGA